MPTYRKRPVEIEALRLPEGGPTIGLYPILGWVNDHAEAISGTPCRLGDNGSLLIETLEGVMRANPGDWIIRGVKGEFYPCKPDIFEATYERVLEDGEALCGVCGDLIPEGSPSVEDVEVGTSHAHHYDDDEVAYG